MDLVGYVTESFVDASKRIQDRMLQRNRRKMRRGEKMQKFMSKIDPSERVSHVTKGAASQGNHRG